MTITSLGNGLYHVDTGDITADHRPIADVCSLSGNVLRTYFDGEYCIHGVPVIRVTLGPVSLARISALAVGERMD